MKLSEFEQKVIACLLKGHKGFDLVERQLPTCTIHDYEYTGAGYFVQLVCGDWNLENETIAKPIVMGKIQNIEVGFLLFTEKETLTLECHSWGEVNPPENIRELDLTITVKEHL